MTMPELAPNRLLYGTDAPLPSQTSLRAGPLSLIFESGDLRYIKLGEHEVIRRIYVALRDRNWGTVPPRLSNLEINAGQDTFQITYEVENVQEEIDFCWQAMIRGERDGTIEFRMDGLARSTFWRNRLGFCVLHPQRECSGGRARVWHPDGSEGDGTFPKLISAEAPFLEIAALSHEVKPDVWAKLEFSGDVFETEDQRNWLDASFKTFCTPLRLPFPVEVPRSQQVAQSVKLTIQGATAIEVLAPPAQIEIKVAGEASGKLPQLGLDAASDGQALSSVDLHRLQALKLNHLRADLDLSRAGFSDVLSRVGHDAAELGWKLEAALFLSDNAETELRQLREALERLHSPIGSWLVFHHQERSTSARWIELARKLLGDWDASVKFGAGTNAYFAELNRERPPIGLLDEVCFSINPQVHAFDHASLVENLESHRPLIESARALSGGVPLAITPITFRPRFNPDATGPEPPPAENELPSPVDPRQMSLFGAGWTLGSLKYLTEEKVESATYFETAGWRGLMAGSEASPKPILFPSVPGSVFPIYHIFAALSELDNPRALPSSSTDNLKVECLVLRDAERTRLFLVNFTGKAQTVVAPALGQNPRAFWLNESNVWRAMIAPEEFRALPPAPMRSAGNCLQIIMPRMSIVWIDTER